MAPTKEPLLVPVELLQELVNCSLTEELWDNMPAVMSNIIAAAKAAVQAKGIQAMPLEGIVRHIPPSVGETAAIFGMYLDGSYPHNWLNAGLRDIGKLAYHLETEEKEKSGRSR